MITIIQAILMLVGGITLFIGFIITCLVLAVRYYDRHNYSIMNDPDMECRKNRAEVFKERSIN